MAGNILRSLEPIRRLVTEAIASPPQLRRDLATLDDQEEYLDELEQFTTTVCAQRDRFSEFYKLLLGTSTSDETLQKQIDDESGKDAVILMEIDGVVAKYTTEIKRVNRKRTYSASNGNGSSSASSAANSAANSPIPVKLPKLQLVTFDGDVLKWNEFWDSFSASVHRNETLNAIDKMNYLKGQLKGSAKESIAGLASSAANYENAIKVLERRFGNKRMIINAHYSALTMMASAQDQQDNLRELFDVIEQHLNSLEALDENISNSQMASLIRSKLPEEVVIHLDQQNGSELWDVKELRTRMHNYLAIRESAKQGRSLSSKSELSATKPKGQRPGLNYSRPLPSTTEALLATGAARNRKNCPFCKESNTHWPDECKRYRTAESRKTQIPDRCFNCFGDSHKGVDCPRTKPCHYCRRVKHHHSSLCPDKFPSSKTSTTAAAAASDELPEASALATTVNTRTVSMLASGESVLLQTASTKLQSADGKFEYDARILLDSCSSRTYITKAMAKRLKLETILVNRLEINTFASSQSKYIDSDLVELKIKLIDGSYFTIEANVIPTITGAVVRIPVNIEKYGNLYGTLPLADKLPIEGERIQPDFLLGNDYFWDLITCERVPLGDGLYLIGSKLGWLFTGRHAVRKETVALAAALPLTSATMLVCARGVTELTLDT